MPAGSVRGGFAAQPAMDPAAAAAGGLLRAGDDAVGECAGTLRQGPSRAPQPALRPAAGSSGTAETLPAVSSTHKHTRFALLAAPRPPPRTLWMGGRVLTYPLDGDTGLLGAGVCMSSAKAQ